MNQSTLLLAVEILGLGALALLLHSRSRAYGLAPLLIYLSGLVSVLHALATVPVFVQVFGFHMAEANMTLVPVVLLAVLVLYVVDGTAAARVTILGIAGLSALVMVLQAAREHQLTLPGSSDPLGLGPGSPIFDRSLTLTTASLVAFLVSLTVVTVVYQVLANRVRWLPGWLLPGLALVAGALADDVVFQTGVYGVGGFLSRFPAGVPGKVMGSVLLWPLAAWYLCRVAPNLSGYLGTSDRPSLDVIFGTYRRKEAALLATTARQRMAEGRLTAVVSSAPLVVFSMDREGTLTLSEGAGLAAMGLKPGQAVGGSAFDIAPGAEDEVRRALAGEHTSGLVHIGDLVFDVTYTPVLEGDEVVSVTGVALDVTGRVVAEEARIESDVRFQGTFEHAAVGLLHVDMDGNIALANRALCELLQADKEALQGSPFVSLAAPVDRPSMRKHLETLLSGEESTITTDRRLLRSDGTPVWVRKTTSVIRDPSGVPRYFIVVVEDLTQRHATEEQLRQAQKMEAVGQLTGGVAHDFNNLLTVVVGGLELAMDQEATPEERTESMGEAMEAAQRGASLVHRLLAFSRRQPLHPVELDPGVLLREMEDLLQRTLGETVLLEIDAPADVGRCLADRSQLESAILNLTLNARDAMPRGGHLTLAVRCVHIAEEQVDGGTRIRPGPFLRITVRDEGAGIEPELLSRVFEPFFTTKPVGKGSGLGLSMVYGFAQQSGGFVTLESRPEEGTAVHLHLPAIHPPA